MRFNFFKSFLYTSIVLSPLVLNQCVPVHTIKTPTKLHISESKEKQTIRRLIQSLSPEHIYKIPLVKRSIQLLLQSPEGTELLHNIHPDTRLTIQKTENQLAGLTKGRTIVLSERTVSDSNIIGITLTTAHEMAHANAPAIPTQHLNNKSAYNLSLNQFLTLYKLNEINARLTEMQLCVDLKYPTNALPFVFKAYAQTYKIAYTKTNTQLNAVQRRQIAMQQTKSSYFKAYLDPTLSAQLDPDFNKTYEKRAFEFIINNNIHLSESDITSTQYDQCLDYYRQKGGDFLSIADLTVSHTSATYAQMAQAIRMDAFFQKYHPEYNYTVRDIFNSLQPQKITSNTLEPAQPEQHTHN